MKKKKQDNDVEQILLDEEEWIRFQRALENPPEPSESLKNAVKKYRQKYKKDSAFD